jgi:hypothetical protein
MALSGGLWFPLAFRRPAFASRSFLLPLGNSAFLAVALLPLVVGRPHRGFHVSHEGDTVGMGALFTPGPSVFTPGQEGVPGPIMIQYRRADRVSAILR